MVLIILVSRVKAPHSAFALLFFYMADSMLEKLGRPSEVVSGRRAYNRKRPTTEFRSRAKEPAADFCPPSGPIREKKGRRRPFAGIARRRQRRCNSDAAALRPLRSGRSTSGARRGGCGEAGEKDRRRQRRRQRRRLYDTAASRTHRSGGLSFWPPTKTTWKSRQRELGGTVSPPAFRGYAGAFRDNPIAPPTPTTPPLRRRLSPNSSMRGTVFSPPIKRIRRSRRRELGGPGFAAGLPWIRRRPPR